MSDLKMYDLSYLEEISMGDEVFIKDMVTQFVTDAPVFIHDMKDFACKGEWRNLFATVHRFASNIDFVGVSNGRKLVDIIENNARNETEPDKTREMTMLLADYCLEARKQIAEDFRLNTVI